MDEAKPHILSELSLSSSLMMTFSWQVENMDAFVTMDSATSHCFVSFAFANTFGLKVK